VLALSIARLHRANLINFGVLPILIGPGEYQEIQQDDRLECEDVRNCVAKAHRLLIRLPEKGIEIQGRLELSPREREVLLAGGRLNHVKTILAEQKKG
jgi:aconitate hydratase